MVRFKYFFIRSILKMKNYKEPPQAIVVATPPIIIPFETLINSPEWFSKNQAYMTTILKSGQTELIQELLQSICFGAGILIAKHLSEFLLERLFPQSIKPAIWVTTENQEDLKKMILVEPQELINQLFQESIPLASTIEVIQYSTVSHHYVPVLTLWVPPVNVHYGEHLSNQIKAEFSRIERYIIAVRIDASSLLQQPKQAENPSPQPELTKATKYDQRQQKRARPPDPSPQRQPPELTEATNYDRQQERARARDFVGGRARTPYFVGGMDDRRTRKMRTLRVLQASSRNPCNCTL